MNDSPISSSPVPAPALVADERPMTPRRFGRAVLTTSAFALFFGGGMLIAWGFFPLLYLLERDELARIRRGQRILARGLRVFHAYMRVTGLLHVRWLASVPPRTGPRILVANHTTLVDATAILAEQPNLCVIAKPSWFHNPLLSLAIRTAGFLPGRNTDSTGRTVLELARERLDQGFDLLVFPEGSRSPPGGLLPFHRGAFEIALRAKAQLQPLFLRCAPSALTRDRAFWDQPDVSAELSIQPGDPLETSQFSGSSRRLCAEVESAYRRAILGRKS